MHWLQRKKPELILMDHFWKNETWPSKNSKNFYYFSSFSWVFSKMIMFIGCLNAFMKCHDPLSSIQQKLAMCYVPFWKKTGKTIKRVNFLLDLLNGQVSFFHKLSIEMSSGFLRCDQCIKTLLLSYQTLPSGNFHFLSL